MNSEITAASMSSLVDVAPGGCRCDAAGDPLLSLVFLLGATILVLRRKS